MAQQSTATTSSILFPPFESALPPLEENDEYVKIIAIEKQIVQITKGAYGQPDILNGFTDRSMFPEELLSNIKKAPKPKLDPLKRLKELPTEEVEEEEETADEEEEDEEANAVEDEDDAGGDYLVSHFDNGEGFEDNDDDGDEMTSMI